VSLFAIFLESVIYFSVTFHACKAITENGGRHHKYANCCQITGFAGSALGSGTTAAGGSAGPGSRESAPVIPTGSLAGVCLRAPFGEGGGFPTY